MLKYCFLFLLYGFDSFAAAAWSYENVPLFINLS